MARIRDDFVFGTLAVELGTGDTTLSSPGLERLSTVASPDVAAITLYDGTDYEIVHVTAHTAAADTATILRGQEGTAAQAWGAGATWLHGPTETDLNESGGTTSGVHAYKTTAQSVATGGFTALTLEAESYDDATYHSTTTNTSRLTIPTTGRYRIFGEIQFAGNTSGTRQATIFKNGTTGTRLGQSNGQPPTDASTAARVQVTTPIVTLTAGDYVELAAHHTAGVNLDILAAGETGTWLCLERIS